jgi:hypothetical protein
MSSSSARALIENSRPWHFMHELAKNSFNIILTDLLKRDPFARLGEKKRIRRSL